MKRVFEIEFPDELGEMWMNQDNLMLCINAYCENRDSKIRATDVTGKVVYLSEDQTLPTSRWGYYQESAAGRHFICTEVKIDPQDMLKQGWRKVEV